MTKQTRRKTRFQYLLRLATRKAMPMNRWNLHERVGLFRRLTQWVWEEAYWLVLLEKGVGIWTDVVALIDALEEGALTERPLN